VCSEDDRKYLGAKPYIHVIPNGFHPQPTCRRAKSALLRLGFVGSFDWKPNAVGMEWFLREVWPLVKRGSPEAQLRLVGRKSDTYFCKLPAGVVGLGWLQDPSDEIGTWSAMVVPIKIGGGTRVKVVEAFARKCPVVATSLGAFGYTVCNGRELLLADSAEDFSLACLRLLRDPELGEALSTNASSYFLRYLTWDSFETAVRDTLEECLSRNNYAYAGGVVAVGA
jgi:glycosyltransferase involved in cell wall biosynthesis